MKQKRDVPIVLGQFLEGINQASASARHMVHHHQDSRFFNLVSILEAVHRMIVAEVVDPMMEKKPDSKDAVI